MLGLYNTAILPLRLLVAPWARWRARVPERRDEWLERTARRLPRATPGGVWIHGASVGEAGIVASLARRLRDRVGNRSLVVSATTRTGRAQLPAPPEVDAAFFLPLDFPDYVRRLFGALRPCALLLVETELWPNLLTRAARDGVSVAVINGRLATERMPRYRRLRRLYAPLLDRFALVGARSETDGERFVELGARRSAVHVTGNLKYDLPQPPGDAESVRAELRLSRERPVFVAGSTGSGEDGPVLDAFARVRRGFPETLLVLAPRHPERADDVERLIRQRGFRVVRLGSLPETGTADADVLLVDGVGRLTQLYRVADVAFVGGSLVPTGGHNVLEPAAVGVPVLFGPHTDHFAEPAAHLERSRGARRVADASDLGEVVTSLLRDEPERLRMGSAAGNALTANRGALDRSVERILDSLDAADSRNGAAG